MVFSFLVVEKVRLGPMAVSMCPNKNTLNPISQGKGALSTSSTCSAEGKRGRVQGAVFPIALVLEKVSTEIREGIAYMRWC